MRHGIVHHGPHFGDTLYGAGEHQWGWILAVGIVFVLLGTVALGTLLTATVLSIYFVGVLLLFGGVAQALQAFAFHGGNNIGTHLLMSGLYLIAGYLVIENPVATSIMLTLLLAAALVILGLVRTLAAMEHRRYRSWGWLLASGLLTMAIGFLIALQWPLSGFWAIGMFVGIDLIFHGLSYMGLGMAVRDAQN